MRGDAALLHGQSAAAVKGGASFVNGDAGNNGDPGHSMSEHWTRYVIGELVGSFFVSVVVGGVLWTNSFTYDPFFSGGAAGAASPPNPLFVCVGVGGAFACGLILAPGCNMNPIFTLMVCLMGRKRWSVLLPSVVSQVAGSLLAQMVLYAMLYDSIQHAAHAAGVDDRDPRFLGLFGVSFPDGHVSNGRAFLCTCVGCIVLCGTILPQCVRFKGADVMNPIPHGFLIGVAVVVIEAFLAGTGGANVNPAGWFAGAFFASLYGWDSVHVWGAHRHYWLVSLFAPIVGGSLSTVAWRLLFVAQSEPPERWGAAVRALSWSRGPPEQEPAWELPVPGEEESCDARLLP